MTQALILDWDGVLEDQTHHLFYVIAAVLEKPFQQVILKLQQEYDNWCLGIQDDHGFWQAVRDTYGLNDQTIEEIQADSTHVFKEKKMWDLVPKLAAQYRTIIAVHCPLSRAAIIKAEADLFLVERTYFSCGIGKSFKDGELLLAIARDLDFSPDSILFVTANKERLIEGKRLTLQTCHFREIQDLLEVVDIV